MSPLLLAVSRQISAQPEATTWALQHGCRNPQFPWPKSSESSLRGSRVLMSNGQALIHIPNASCQTTGQCGIQLSNSWTGRRVERGWGSQRALSIMLFNDSHIVCAFITIQSFSQGKHTYDHYSAYPWKLPMMNTSLPFNAATPAFSQFLKSAKFSLATGPLHQCIPSARMVSPPHHPPPSSS